MLEIVKSFYIVVESHEVSDGSGILDFTARFAQDYDPEDGIPYPGSLTGKGENEYQAAINLLQKHEEESYA